jgi:dTDP-4-amino-4,6-dideoxygalactose transaminase
MLTACDPMLAQKLRLFAAHGMLPRYYHQVVGINSRLDSLQAAALLVKLGRLADGNRQRSENAARYYELFGTAGLDRELGLPATSTECDHVWNQFTIRVPHGRRDSLREYLSQRGIGTEIYYPVPLHRQACFSSLGYESGSLPESERAAAEVLSLPIFPGLRAEEQQSVVDQIASYFHASRLAA